MKKILSVLVLLQAIPSFGYSNSKYHHRHDWNNPNCVEEYVTKLTSSTLLNDSCEISKPLELTYGYQNYPYLTQNPRKVSYWLGQYNRVAVTTTNYLRELVDTCRGKVLTSKQFSAKSYQNFTFDIENPNLSSSIKESYMLVPLSDEEAAQSFVDTEKRCKTFKLITGS